VLFRLSWVVGEDLSRPLLPGRQQTIPFVIQTQKPPGPMGIKGQRIEDFLKVAEPWLFALGLISDYASSYSGSTAGRFISRLVGSRSRKRNELILDAATSGYPLQSVGPITFRLGILESDYVSDDALRFNGKRGRLECCLYIKMRTFHGYIRAGKGERHGADLRTNAY
jgi:hypothetical protein